MPRLREKVRLPRKRKLGEYMRTGEGKAFTIVGSLVCFAMALWGASYIIKFSVPHKYSDDYLPAMVAGAFVVFIGFVGFLIRAIQIGTEDQSKIDNRKSKVD